ncbi:MAG: isoleucine--tRNA ligase [Candidatus Diapherotrites archaeon]
MYSPKEEEKWIAFWKTNQLFEKSVKNRSEKKSYIFYDGPPFATGLPHHGHILGLTIKDVFPRYYTMKGFRVERKWGWDCHGLPIENIVEKKQGLKNKRQIDEMGIEKFNHACQKQVLEYAHEWGKTVERMGKWIEFNDAYKTMDQSYMETVWWIFKKLYEEGHIYEGKKILMYCPRCQTPLAKAEIQMDNSYRDVKEPAVTVKFKIKGEKNTYFLAWTTTPWTLIGNAALAVNEKRSYSKIRAGNETYILGKERLSEIKEKYEIIEHFRGEKILGMEYEPLYHLDTNKKGHYIVAGGDGVTAEDGTGIVHVASYGEFDFDLITKYDLPLFTHIGRDGTLHGGHEEWKGMWFKKADPLIIQDLEKRKLVYKKEEHTHSYPFCYRCETPLFYNPINSWFVRIQNVKEKLIQCNKEITWIPEGEGKLRFMNILETAPDWTISRNRYWATAIPVWKCTHCREMKIMGSVRELQENAIEKVPNTIDLHRHVIDNIHLKCTCGKTMQRIPEVIDCWFESGSMPYAAKHYPFENKEWFTHHFPSDFVSEYVGQVRAWFYYMHVLGVLLFQKAPFKNVIVSGNILASDGSKMAKSRNNYTDPALLFEKYGADSLRYYLMQSPVTQAVDINFKDEGVQEVYRKIILLLANTLSFYEMYAQQNNNVTNPHSPHVLDQWIIARLHETINHATKAMNAYDMINTTRVIGELISDLSTWYLRRSRERLKGNDAQDKQNSVRTLGYVLHSLSKIMAPITPFIAEEIHQSLRKNCNELKESVHLEDWPASNEKEVDMNLIQKMVFVREAVSLALEQREREKIPVRQPLAKATIYGIELNTESHPWIIDIFKEEVNVKKVEFIKEPKNGQKMAELDTRITGELLAEGAAREFTRVVQDLRKNAKLNPEDEVQVFIQTEKTLEKMLTPHLTEIKEKVRANNITFAQPKSQTKKDTSIKIKENDAHVWIV